MPQTHKILGQATAGTTATTLYTVPASTQAVCSSLVVANLSTAAAATYRLSCRPSGTAQTNAMYLVYDASVPAADSTILTLGMTLTATDVVTVFASNTAVAFNLFGVEIT
jgi:hypothetical protein